MENSRLRIVFHLIIQLVCAWTILQFFNLHYPLAFDGSSPADFPNYYFPGVHLFEGKPLYAPIEGEVKSTLGWNYDVYPADPPPTLIFLAPLSLLSYFDAWHLFLIISVFCVALSAWITGKNLGWSTLGCITTIFLFLASAPSLFLFKRNHMESIILLLSVLGWSAARKGNPQRCFALWGGAAALKIFPFFWLLGAFRTYGLRAIRGGIFIFAFLMIGSGFVIGFDELLKFFTDVVPKSHRWYGAVGNYSPVSFGAALGSFELGFVLSILFLLLLLRKRYWITSFDDCFTKGMVLSLLVSPLSWMNYFILLFAPLCALSERAQSSSRAVRVLFALTALSIWGFPGYLEGPTNLSTVLLSFIPLYAALALFFLSDRLYREAKL